jgi:hypothetical protein
MAVTRGCNDEGTRISAEDRSMSTGVCITGLHYKHAGLRYDKPVARA